MNAYWNLRRIPGSYVLKRAKSCIITEEPAKCECCFVYLFSHTQITIFASCEFHPCELEFQEIVEQAVYEKFENESLREYNDP